MLSRIIAGKTKHVKDPFSSLIRAEGSNGAGYRPFNAFWEKWGNARKIEIEITDQEECCKRNIL
ncbi:hypothetical protein [Klebsiella aerogenes]|uniref:hypothetical protein n=1 Tax=Klebsiella aerogenes TaxID=548 RepID=UPI0013A603BB|nr:hypothetical protein [Klebsiella aerogenes]HCB2860393.1 hypothetical protein [Klebsiella aerogenes]HCB2865726.1 hypothetical protein [Klebsiella aerogenes]HCB2881625.1 hypothetical protein [Klebsiella aerogenes]HCB3346415.1 hypothetical protein [Klebsiella aerogenes]HCM1812461.1 hypothetical protein [Klebsiella aerogenes]